MKEYEAIIIGGGGGLKLRPIADMGHKIAIIEKDFLGGTCLNRGCIPSKMLIHPADFVEELGEAEKFNLKVSKNFEVDFAALVKRVNESVSGTSKSIAEAYKKRDDIDYYHEEAHFVDDKIIEVGGEEITANKIFIATGSRPFIPSIEGLEGTPYMTSTEVLKSTKQPKRAIVVGGGYIGVELGHYLAGLGTEVEFLVRSKLLAREDEDIVHEFSRAFEKRVKLHVGFSPDHVDYHDGMFTVKAKTKEGEEMTIEADALVIATGVIPNSDTLYLDHTSIETDKRGFIKVNDKLETSVSGVYALGDVVGNHFFRHSVNFEGEYLLRRLYEEPSEDEIIYPPMPSAVFSNPQIGRVGVTEEEAKDNGVDYFIGRTSYKNSAMGGDVLQSDLGLCKLIFRKSDKKLIGAHVVGKEASNMIHMPIAFMNMEATLDDMLRTIYIHPAFPEIIRNAARNARAELKK